MSIDNEELSSLLTTIRNQEREIEVLNKEAESMRKNIEHFNEEHLLREKAAEAEAPKKTRKPCARKAAAPKAEKETKATKAKATRAKKAAPEAPETPAE